jgi:hypothetical protein
MRIMCNCQSLSECVEAVPTRNNFVGTFTKLDHSTKLWAELFVCNICGQHWIVEEGAEMDRRSNKAFKISSPDNWLEHDTNPALANWLVKQHGGVSEQQCMFAGCEKMALKNMVVCVVHGHSEFEWSKDT